jgi:cbb3-type cytochrome oxidase subunit 3
MLFAQPISMRSSFIQGGSMFEILRLTPETMFLIFVIELLFSGLIIFIFRRHFRRAADRSKPGSEK